MSHAHAMRQLRDLWPEEFPDEKIKAMAEALAAYDPGLLNEAVQNLARTAKFRPRLSELTEEMARIDLCLPSPEVAWHIFTKGDLGSAAAPVRAAAEYVGGRATLKFSDASLETVRSQFRKAYESLYAQAFRDYRTGTRAIPAGFVTERAALAPAMQALPESTSVRPRPMMLRWIKSRSGAPLPPPTDEERADLIRVLEAGPPEHGDPDPVYLLAERTFAEYGVSPARQRGPEALD